MNIAEANFTATKEDTWASQAKTTGWEVTLERQKLRAQALLDEFAALVEYGARKVLGEAACTAKQHLLSS